MKPSFKKQPDYIKTSRYRHRGHIITLLHPRFDEYENEKKKAVGADGAPALGGTASGISAKASEALQVEDTGEASPSSPSHHTCVVSCGWWGSGVTGSPVGTGMFTLAAPANGNIRSFAAAAAASAKALMQET